MFVIFHVFEPNTNQWTFASPPLGEGGGDVDTDRDDIPTGARVYAERAGTRHRAQRRTGSPRTSSDSAVPTVRCG